MRTWLLVALVLAPASAPAEPSAEEIANKAFAQEFMGTSTGVSQVKMTLVNKRGAERVRRIQSRSAKVDGLRKTMVRFLSPADVQGTSFLLLERVEGADDQYLYLPALKRTRRIAGGQKKSSFMGTDFSYSDMESRDVSGSTWKKLPDEKIGSLDCFHIEASPKDPKDEQYSRTEMWIHKETWLPIKMKFYERVGGKHRKTLFVEKFDKVDGRWIVMEAKMRDEKKGTYTRILIESIDLKTPVPDTEFTVEALSKG